MWRSYFKSWLSTLFLLLIIGGGIEVINRLYKEYARTRPVPHVSLTQAETCAANARRWFGEDTDYDYENQASAKYGRCYVESHIFKYESLADITEHKEIGHCDLNAPVGFQCWIIPAGETQQTKLVDNLPDWYKIANEYMTDKD